MNTALIDNVAEGASGAEANRRASSSGTLCGFDLQI